jgi:hypothetical protein
MEPAGMGGAAGEGAWERESKENGGNALDKEEPLPAGKASEAVKLKDSRSKRGTNDLKRSGYSA